MFGDISSYELREFCERMMIVVWEGVGRFRLPCNPDLCVRELKYIPLSKYAPALKTICEIKIERDFNNLKVIDIITFIPKEYINDVMAIGIRKDKRIMIYKRAPPKKRRVQKRETV